MSSKPKSVPSDILSLPNASPRLINHELAPLKHQTWGTYNIFCYWMSDVHSVGGYVFAGSLFAFGLASWQVLICLLVGIQIVQFVANKVAKPSQKYGVPYPVICRSPFGVLGQIFRPSFGAVSQSGGTAFKPIWPLMRWSCFL